MDLEEWITRRERSTRLLLDLIDLNPGDPFARRGDETLQAMQAMRQTLAKAARYDEIRSSNSENARSATKTEKIRKRNLEMAREFRKRAAKRGVVGGNRSDIALMIEIGRLPRFSLRRAAAYNAIRAGLDELDRVKNNSSGQRRRVD
ncbi:hypothetical protein IVB11_29910 [Bradyrhizobium sp. 177]|uniref:hypothetical protein n=1 Tax=Bradyrhizobium sp. 177 TaxID=2782647 RepID=UPI001FF99017|nr:hypothetical protein [Bradyrhizobium sp. 177]MCK1553142.1 hypothetical protein [Bradyrhizobium sp. 177]